MEQDAVQLSFDPTSGVLVFNNLEKDKSEVSEKILIPEEVVESEDLYFICILS